MKRSYSKSCISNLLWLSLGFIKIVAWLVAFRNSISSIIKLAFILLAFNFSIVAANQLDSPFAIANRQPFIQIYGLPDAKSGQLVSVGASLWKVQLDAASNASYNNLGNEIILLDGESHRLNLAFSYGWADKFELGVELPFISQQGGFLDRVIDIWHDSFALNEGVRPLQMKNQLRYFYRRGNNTLFDLNQSSIGIGDIRLNLAYQLSNTLERQWALRGGVKLPTGNSNKLHGSQSTDVYLAGHMSEHGLWRAQNLTLHASSGVLWMSSGKVLDQYRKNWVGFSSSTLSWRYRQNLSLKVQLDYHSAFYDSELTQLGDSSVQLILGATIQVNKKWLIDLSISEDIVLGAAPDVVFQLGFTVVEF